MIRGRDFGGFGVRRRAKFPMIGGNFTTASISGNRQEDINETCPSETSGSTAMPARPRTTSRWQPAELPLALSQEYLSGESGGQRSMSDG
jgi:hypothetical protein